jgi:hypothetical protein
MFAICVPPYAHYCVTVTKTCQGLFLCYSIPTLNRRNPLGAIADRLEAIEKVLRKCADSISASEEREEQRQNKPTEIRGEVWLPRDIEERRGTEQESQQATQRWIARGTWAATIAAIIYAGIAAYQVHWMRIATTATQQQLADARAAQIARLTIEFPPPTITEQPNKDIYAKGTIVIKNIGGTPALEPVVKVDFGSGTEPPQWGNYKINIVSNPKNFPIATTAPVELPYDKLVGNDTEMRADRQYASFLVQVAYRDVYGTPYSFSACYLYAPQFQRFYRGC